SKAHGAPLGEAEVRLIKERLGFDPEKPVEVPAEVREFFAEWRVTRREASDAWRRREEAWKKAEPAEYAAWRRALAGEIDGDPLAAAKVPAAGEKVATRSAGGSVLQVAAAAVPELLPGSADLFESNKTAIAGAKPFSDRDPAGRNVYYGVREHAMGAIANGLALHGGVRPVTSTFLVFADYMRPPIRLAALMELPVVFVFTHDSVWVGEDGPTHQPIEQLDSLRIIPGVHVVRPADARETIAAWRHALLRRHPTVLVLTRQNLPVLERAAGTPELGLAGVVHEPAGAPRLAIVASGSEVALGVEAAAMLAKEGVPARVVSVPCVEQLREAPAPDVDRLLLPDVPRLVVEAATGYTWGEWVRPGDGFHGIRRFGASAPGAVVAEKLGLSAEAVAAAARNLLR
ncbi:MAG: transketolase, partial [Gemmatimonadetes bacterium]|nr:transketolase [Gemmatimonadota bacterium]